MNSQNTPPLIGEGEGDFAAWHKLITGAWIYDIVTGEIISRKTGRPLIFQHLKHRQTTWVKVHNRGAVVEKARIARIAVHIAICEGHLRPGSYAAYTPAGGRR